MVMTPHLLRKEGVVLFRMSPIGLPNIGQTHSTVSKMTFGTAPMCQLWAGGENILFSNIIINPTWQINNPGLGPHIYFVVLTTLLLERHKNSPLTLVPSKDASICTQVYGQRRETLIDGARR